MVEVAVELVHAGFAEVADLGMEKDAVGVGAEGEKLADGCVGLDADGFVVLHGNN